MFVLIASNSMPVAVSLPVADLRFFVFVAVCLLVADLRLRLCSRFCCQKTFSRLIMKTISAEIKKKVEL